MNDELEPAHPRRAAAGQADRVRLPRHRAGRFAEGQPGSRDFSVEMETGTGETYVYLRTALELYQHYGFHKFIVVVPSVAIREGVLKTLRITRDLFTVTQLVDPLREPPSRSVAQSWNSVYN